VKLVTNDYGCGTSSSILDYDIRDVIIVSEDNYEHVFEAEDDLLFIGHDFLFYLWDSEEKLKRWISYTKKFEAWVWCFERIDCIVPAWQQKSHVSLSIASKFCKRILACDEDDCDKYGFDWLPQWASKKFYERKDHLSTDNRILFSGQAGGPEYHTRNVLLKSILDDTEFSKKFHISNVKRSLSWDQYIENLLKHNIILNPVGIMKALNTRAYEALYSGRILLQHTAGRYKRHENLLNDCPGVTFFEDLRGLKDCINRKETLRGTPGESYTKHSLYARMKSIGVDIK
jgi:hypothetical protein